MSKFNDSPLTIYIWKDLLPKVHVGRKGVPFVKIPDPQNPGETIHFISLPGDDVDELYTLAAAYLALAQHQETLQGQAVARDWGNPANTNGIPAATAKPSDWDVPRFHHEPHPHP